MAQDKVSLVFFGSGPVSAATLEFVSANFEVEAVVTKPSTFEEMKASAPKTPVYTAKDQAGLSKLVPGKRFKSRLGLVVDFGIIIGKDVIDSFPLGIVNSHFSLLPRWRGADPISFAILAGDKQTGASLMLIDQSLDTGDLIAQEKLDIPPGCTTPELTEKLVGLSNKMLRECLPKYAGGVLKPYPQPDQTEATYSRKLTKSDGIIDWDKPAERIEREIRAFAGWPRSVGEIGGYSLIIASAKVIAESGKPGDYEASKDSLVVFCGKGALDIRQAQPPGKKQMPIAAFLRGYNIENPKH
jgi:methionyl-tRNA formyltransferase